MPKKTEKTYNSYTEIQGGAVAYEQAIDILDHFNSNQDHGKALLTRIHQCIQSANTKEKSFETLEKRLDRATAIFKYLRIPFNRTVEFEGSLGYGVVTLSMPITEAMGIVDIAYGKRTEDSERILEQRLLTTQTQGIPFEARLMINPERVHQLTKKGQPHLNKPEKLLLGAIAQSIVDIICEPEPAAIQEGMYNGTPTTYQLQAFLEKYYPGTTPQERITNFLDYAQSFKKHERTHQHYGYATEEERQRTLEEIRGRKKIVSDDINGDIKGKLVRFVQLLPQVSPHQEKREPSPTIDDIITSVHHIVIQRIRHTRTEKEGEQLIDAAKATIAALAKTANIPFRETAEKAAWSLHETATAYRHVNGVADHLPEPLTRTNCESITIKLINHYRKNHEMRTL
ncbi:MAG: hypothetical protein Q7R56_00145 [Nanoarchaeota archaeon]|nr:hypothetical protein [Nanoarchaeota archaeon]